MPRLLLLILVAFLVGAASAAVGQKETAPCPLFSDWESINNVNDTSIVAIGKFAVREHNRQSNGTLVYQEVLQGERLSIAGTTITIYDLILSAPFQNGPADIYGARDTYWAIVYEVYQGNESPN